YLYPAPYERHGLQADNSTDFDALLAQRIANAAAGIAGPDAEPLLSYDLSGKVNGGRPFYDTQWKNFAPRVGFAWSPSFNGGVLGTLFGDRKSSVRGSFGVTYDRVGGAITFIQNQVDYIFANSATLQFGQTGNPVASLTNDPRFTSLPTLPVTVTPPTITRPFIPFEEGGLVTQEFNYGIVHNFKIPKS